MYKLLKTMAPSELSWADTACAGLWATHLGPNPSPHCGHGFRRATWASRLHQHVHEVPRGTLGMVFRPLTVKYMCPNTKCIRVDLIANLFQAHWVIQDIWLAIVHLSHHHWSLFSVSLSLPLSRAVSLFFSPSTFITSIRIKHAVISLLSLKKKKKTHWPHIPPTPLSHFSADLYSKHP